MSRKQFCDFARTLGISSLFCKIIELLFMLKGSFRKGTLDERSWAGKFLGCKLQKTCLIFALQLPATAAYVKITLSEWVRILRQFINQLLVIQTQSWSSLAGALVKWLWVSTHVRKVVGSNPGAIYWMAFFHIDLL